MPGRGRDRKALRRRRRVAAAAALLAVAGVAAGVWAVLDDGGSDNATTTAAQTTPRITRPRPSTGPAKADLVLARLTRIGLPVYCGGHRGKYVALTFDDGPGPYTPLALRILRQAHVRATFFLVGRKLDEFHDLPAQELELGTLGDHTWTHTYLPALGPDALMKELADTKRAIAALTHRPVRLFRPPYGAHNAAVDSLARKLGMLQVLWSIDSLDSQGADFRGIQQTVLREIRPGSIVLLHENRGQTIEALKFFILPELKRRGLVPVTVEELLTRDPPTMAQLRAGAGGC
jgi:peptidoglycan/xylan/chitin deacetylase (PgdA/CDA1 family)